MPTPIWEPGVRYAPGSLVQPRSTPPAYSTTITNPGLESGGTGWTFDSGVTASTGYSFSGAYAIQFTGNSGTKRALGTAVPCAPGKQITASCMYAQGAASSGNNTGRVVLRWLNASNALIREDVGNLVSDSSPDWQLSTVTGVGPAGTASVQIGALSNRSNSSTSFADQFSWDYTVPVTIAGLIFKAVQAAAGYSGNTEPTWPPTLGLTVVDNEVTWEAVTTSRVVWQAKPLLTSGGTEPDWPTVVGGVVADGPIRWRAISRRVTDPNCPRSKIVLIAASKVFAGDDDIIRHSATNNPLDWTTNGDAGFIPFGTQQYGANPVAALGLYRGNVVAFNSESFQMWQVDPDPKNFSKIDELPLGSTFHFSMAPVSNDLLFLSFQGIRSVGISGATGSLQSGDVGMPIDPMIAAQIELAENEGHEPIATYYPNRGQYWIAFPVDGDEVMPVFISVTLWGQASGSGGIYIDPAEEWNNEISGADSAQVIGYYDTEATAPELPPGVDPLSVDVTGIAYVPLTEPIALTTGNVGPGTSIWWADYPNALPRDGWQYVRIEITVGASSVEYHAVIFNSPGF